MAVDPISVNAVSKTVSNAITAFADYSKTKEIQKTERIRVRACLKAITKQIESNRAMFEKYLETSFVERERLYKTGDLMINSAIQKGDLELAKMGCNFILAVYNKDPMQGFQFLDGGGVKDYLGQNNIKGYIE